MKKLEWVPCILVAVVSFSGSTPSGAQSKNYMPLTLTAPFPLKKIGTFDGTPAKLATAAGPGGSGFTVAKGMLTFDGQDSQKKRWHVDLFEVPVCAEVVSVYEADLDRDGITDAILLRPTCGNGLAPTVHLLTVTFGSDGRPVPFEAEGYFDKTRNGIDALVDFDRDNRADLIFMNFDDGYWITNVYSIDRGRWRRQMGHFGGSTFPLYTRFTNRPNTKPVTPPANRHPWAPDLSNTNAQVTGILVEWNWPDRKDPIKDASDLDLRLKIADSNGRRVTCTPQYWHDSARLIVDSPEGRQITHLSEQGKVTVDSVLASLVSKRLSVSVFGRRYSDRCSPELVWATQRGPQ